MQPQTIRYGDDPSQLVELTVPEGRVRGVVVVIHGGFWKAAYDLSLGRPLAADLAGRGWAALNIEYRRVGPAGSGGGGGVPATTDDVRAAVATLDATGLDLSTVVALGHSAGGHLAAWAGHAVGSVTHVVAQAGVLDLVAAEREGLGGGAVRAFLGHPAGPADADVDPRRQVPLDVPVWCVHARDDDTVPFSQSEEYVAAAVAAGATAELVEVPGGHYEVIDATTEAWRRIVEVLDRIG
ncbi:MAG TPA: alpha/beta hydrolase [Nocardioides sp.]|uniref:alpha/beta hydrolase family protein n=1 Tax=Nocardioides sp. TaxID=35761 RepID=UPI002E32B590|nr:alpha/beta hydrolase [Nocardioides sp.]HEX5087266.1 alpha/beta hydrolase [Nocardioides sp.]